MKISNLRQQIHLLTGLAFVYSFLFSALVYAEAGESTWRQDLYENNISSVVSVLPQMGDQRRNAAEPEGTGVAVDGFILTANHVLDNANRILIRDHIGNVSEATVYLRDKATDLALLKTESSFPVIAIDEYSDTAAIGSDVCVTGNAFGLGLTLTCGIVSSTDQRGIGFNFLEDFLQIDAAVNPGMSGAPVFDEKGKLVGLVSAIFTKKSDGNLGVNFASSLRLIRAFIEDAKDGRIDRPRPGLVMQNAPLPGDTGRAGGLVKAIASASAEELAGLKVGDLILKANDLVVKGQADYLAALALAGVGGQMQLELLRDEKQQTIQYDLQN